MPWLGEEWPTQASYSILCSFANSSFFNLSFLLQVRNPISFLQSFSMGELVFSKYNLAVSVYVECVATLDPVLVCRLMFIVSVHSVVVLLV